MVRLEEKLVKLEGKFGKVREKEREVERDDQMVEVQAKKEEGIEFEKVERGFGDQESREQVEIE